MVVGDSEYIVTAQDKVGCLQQMAMLTTSIYTEPPARVAPYVQGRMHGVGDEGVRTLLSS